MYLKYIQIVNFKNLKSARFEFSKGANTIIGENDSGEYVGRILHPAAAVFYSCGGEI
ncbi:MAG: hypothetical protein ACOX8T_11430 [Bacillota bacterium]|jgi:hypothetical protein